MCSVALNLNKVYLLNGNCKSPNEKAGPRFRAPAFDQLLNVPVTSRDVKASDSSVRSSNGLVQTSATRVIAR